MMFPEAGEYFADVSGMFVGVPRKDKYVIQVNHYEFVKEVGKDAVHEALESCRSIGKTKMHDHEIERAILSLESGLPFVTWSDANEVVGCLKINLGVNIRMAKAIKEVWDERQWITILFGDSIEATPVNA